MRKIFFAILLFPIITFAQKKETKLYANVSLIYKKSLTLTKSPPFAVGGVIGGRFKNLGLGLGFEAFKIESQLATAIPIFLDVRYFFETKHRSKQNSFLPFVALNLGKLIWNTNYSNNTGLDNTVFYYKGRSILNIEAGVHVNQKQKKHGVYIAAGFKYLTSNNYSENTNSYRIGPGGVIVIGTPVVTKYPTQKVGNNNLYIKVGYQF